MENLLTCGIAVRRPTPSALSLLPQIGCMIHMTDKTGRFDDAEGTVRLVRDAPSDLVAQLSAPERLLARSIRDRLGVSE